MATLPYNITTKENLKTFLGITDTNSDSVLDSLCNAVTDFIENYCGGRRFLATDYVEVKDTYASSTLFMRQRPCNSVTVVEYRSGVPSSPVWNTYNANGYLVYLASGFIRFFTKFAPTPQAIRISYNAGYKISWANVGDPTLHNLPQDLTQVATELAAKTFNTRNSQGIIQESTEGQTVIYEQLAKELVNNHKDVLRAYMINRVAP